MIKAVEAIMMFTLFVFVFFAGVNYSDTIKSRASWLFETNEEEAALPDIVDENLDSSELISEEKSSYHNDVEEPIQATATNRFEQDFDANQPVQP